LQSEDTAAILVTGAETRIGKSTTAANYASLAAFGGAHVLLVDADVRNPVQHEIFGIARSPGLVEFVASQGSLEEFVQRVTGNFDVLTSGQAVARASDVVHSHRIADLLHHATHSYDVVVCDSAPVLATADAEAIATHAGVQVVFVVDESSKRRNVMKALRRFELINASIAGIVLNRSGEPVVYGN
jgi:tyrosine-protein kinase Etk/Wzc